MEKKLILKATQTYPDFPPKLIRQYQVVAHVIRYYSLPSSIRRPAIPNEAFFLRNLYKAPRFSIVDSWTNVKKLLKGRT